MSASPRSAPGYWRSTSRSRDPRAPHVGDTLTAVILFFEILLVISTVVITWFALYAVYRLITDES